MLEFNPENHEYRWDGKIVPSVTQVISEFLPFDGPDNDVVRNAAHFGSAVHKATEFRDMGKNAEIDPQLEPWLAGWELFKSEWLPTVKKGIVIADIKTGQPSLKWAYQLGAYYELCHSKLETEKPLIEFQHYSYLGFAGTVDRVYFQNGIIRPVTLVAVRLLGNGDYTVHKSPNPPDVDRNAFVSMLNVWNILKKHKKLKNQEVFND